MESRNLLLFSSICSSISLTILFLNSGCELLMRSRMCLSEEVTALRS